MTGPTPATRETVAVRAGYHCELCYTPISGQASIHHRRPRRMGGTRRSDVNEPANLMLLCGSGTTGCHGWVESHRKNALADGIILYDRDIPAEHPYKDRHGNWWLIDKEGKKQATNPRADSGVGSLDINPKGSTVTVTVDNTAKTEDLATVRELTMQIRQRQRDIEELSHNRRTAIQRLRGEKVTYREIAEAMGTTEQNVYKILREFIAQQNANKHT
jgi:hypothetical protein